MGYSKFLYIGPYIKVHPPIVETISEEVTCTNVECTEHGKYLRTHKFCSTCGSPIGTCQIKKMRPLCMHSFLEKVIGDIDIFRTLSMEFIGISSDDKYSFILPNKIEQGGVDTDKYGEHSLPDLTKDHFEHQNWKTLLDKLKENGIEHQAIVGILYYYY